MSWTLISQTESGYKKYKDQYGNFRYLDSNGDFTNQNAWAGAQSHGEQEIPEYSGGVSYEDKTTDKREDLGSYKNAEDIIYDEPYEDSYTPPIDFPFIGRGYPVEDYPSQKRLEMLVEDVNENPDFHHYSFTVVVATYDEDGSILSRGERHTKLLPSEDEPQLRADWANMMEEVTAASASYGGAVIFKTKVKMREYKA